MISFGKTEITFQVDAGYLRVTCRGEHPSPPYSTIMTAVRDEARKAGLTRILVDALRVAAPSHEFDRFWFGSAVAEFFPGREFKVALLFPTELINRFGEDTAVNRGARFLVIGAEEPALDWLMQ